MGGLLGRWLGAYVGGCCLARMVRQEQIHIYHHLLGGRQTAGLEVPKGVGSTKTYAAKPTCLTHKITWPHKSVQPFTFQTSHVPGKNFGSLTICKTRRCEGMNILSSMKGANEHNYCTDRQSHT